jgi:hypothetical protein
LDANQFEAFMEGSDLDLDGFPESLEELEDLERSIFKERRVSKKKSPAADRIPVQEILDECGLSGKATLKRVRKLLPEHIARLFNHQSLVEDQAVVLRDALTRKVPLCCDHPACRALMEQREAGVNSVATSNPAFCRICQGSTARRGLEELAQICSQTGIRRILVLGGSPASHQELKSSAPSGLEFRLIEGDTIREKQRVTADLKWCDLVVLWAGTILDHAVSNQYLKGGRSGTLTVAVAKRRSVEALCAAVIETVQRKKD